MPEEIATITVPFHFFQYAKDTSICEYMKKWWSVFQKYLNLLIKTEPIMDESGWTAYVWILGPKQRTYTVASAPAVTFLGGYSDYFWPSVAVWGSTRFFLNGKEKFILPLFHTVPVSEMWKLKCSEMVVLGKEGFDETIWLWHLNILLYKKEWSTTELSWKYEDLDPQHCAAAKTDRYKEILRDQDG